MSDDAASPLRDDDGAWRECTREEGSFVPSFLVPVFSSLAGFPPLFPPLPIAVFPRPLFADRHKSTHFDRCACSV
jgi:hypothetical protein